MIQLEMVKQRPGPNPRSVWERFWYKVLIGDGCWEWQGATTEGYGFFRLSSPRRTVLAHRLAYELWYGVEPSGLVLHHCDNRPCVRPDHLYDGGYSDNIKDAYDRERRPRVAPPQPPGKGGTACKYGHPYTAENVYWATDGRRRCRACIAAAIRRRHERRHPT